MSSREIDLSATIIDSLGFAAEGGRLAGGLPLANLARLSDVLVRPEGWLECELAGERITDASGQSKSLLHLKVTGRLKLLCQRCLSEVAFDCRIDSRLLLIPEGIEWPADEMETDEYDALPASRELSVLTLVEDEVLLALPIVPRHADCRLPGGWEWKEATSPFAALAQLHRH
ncbi:MAG: DUF177 domain-containing protein [Rhodocyclaceae bacterium]|nr:DUF177 domain-containing protein [Rhodocyclaceae bacterium]